MSNTLSNVESPCVRNCCLDDKDMCLGCFRMLDEILIWGTASSQQQLDILKAIAVRKLIKAKSELQ